MGYWKYATPEELHRHSKIWLSEIAFWKDELTFMLKLVNSHFVFFVDEKRLRETLSLTRGIRAIKQELAAMEDSIAAHEKRLKRLLQLQGRKREEDYRNEHGSLEKIMGAFLKRYRVLKKALFSEADKVLKEAKNKRLTHPTD